MAVLHRPRPLCYPFCRAKMSSVVPGRGVDYYLERGWKLVSPVRRVCPKCLSALLQPPEGQFMYCTFCEAKVMEESQLAGAAAVPESAGAEASPDAETEVCDRQSSQEPPGAGKMGRLLLQGWAMSALPCPRRCNVPLLRDPKDRRRVVCCACGFSSEAPEYAEPEPKVDVSALVRQISERVRAHVAAAGEGLEAGESESEGGEGAAESRSVPGVSEDAARPPSGMTEALMGKMTSLARLAVSSSSPEEIVSLCHAIEALEGVRKILGAW